VQISYREISGELRRDTVEETQHSVEVKLSQYLRTQAVQHAVHFVLGVVVNQPDSQEATALFHSQPFGQIDGVVVAVPGEDALLA
jgi:hypothetical protein